MSSAFRDIMPIPIEELRTLRQQQASEGKQLSLLVPPYMENKPAEASRSFGNAVKYGWARNELVYACISKTAKAKGSVRLIVKRVSDDAEVDNHPMRQIIHRPNPYMSEADFWAATTIFQKLSGHAYWEVVANRRNEPVQLWPLRPDWVRAVRTSQGIAGWQYGPPGLEPITMRPEQIIDLGMFDPMGMFSATSPAVVAGYAVDIDNAVSAFAKDFFERGALPAGLLTTTQKLYDADVDRIQARWNQRYGGARSWITAPAVLDADAKYDRIAMSFEEMGFEALDSRNEVRICMVMDIPPILVGANVGLERATYSNAEQAEVHWWRNTLVPDLHHDRDALTRDLLEPYFGDSVYLQWDFSDVPSLGEDQDALWTRAKLALESGAILVDEYREMIGFEELPDGKGQVFIVNSKSTVTPIDEYGAPKPAPALPGTLPMMAPDDMMPMVDGEDDDEDESDDDDDVTTEKRAAGPGDGKAANPPDDAARRKRERSLTGALEEYFAGQLQRIETQLRTTV